MFRTGRHFVGAAILLGLFTAPGPVALAAAAHEITWDSRSLKIDDHRVFIWSGEMHPFRLPSPGAWRDVLQKMRAIGFNTVSFYFPWGYFTPSPGVYDFSGVRDIDGILRMAEEESLYVIVRAGPYVNAELSRGGFPTWLVTQHAKARTDAPEYLRAVDEWYAHVNPIFARHQLTTGGGTIIAFQIDNELRDPTPEHARYLEHLAARARADGITVPLFHNDMGHNGYWVPPSSSVPGVAVGPVDLYAWDGYPGGSCRFDATPGAPTVASDYGWYGAGGARGGSSASPLTPGFTAEFGNGWFDYWGSNGLYGCLAERLGGGYERVFYATNIANGLTIQSFYMIFGGTSWGWLPAPVVYTSYDYGAAIDEGRGLRPKALVLKQMGEFIAAAAETLAGMTKGGPMGLSGAAIQASSDRIKLYHNINPDNGAHLIVAMHNPSSALSDDSFRFTIDTADGHYTIPRTGALRVNGQDSKLLLAAYDLGRQRLVYSTSQLQTVLRQGERDVALFYGRSGEDGETVLRYGSEPGRPTGQPGRPMGQPGRPMGQPVVRVLHGDVASHYEAASGELFLNYAHRGLQRVLISGGGRASLLLLIADEGDAQKFWRHELSSSGGAVLVRGPALVREASASGNALMLTGDTVSPAELEVWAPAFVGAITWNSKTIPVSATASGSLQAAAPLAGIDPVTLPDIWKGRWLRRPGSPESACDFDDSGWQPATKTDTASITKPLPGLPVLTMDDYGFHQGDVWYRGRYQGDGVSSRLELVYGAGAAGLLQVWIDGHYLGQDELATGRERPATVGSAVFTLPAQALSKGQQHVIAVMVRNDGHNWDLMADEAHKEGRGLISASLSTPPGARFAVPISWRIEGMGEQLRDTARGVMNVGGSFGELNGWYLPGAPEDSWQSTSPGSPAPPGTMWLRTRFNLDLPAADDVQLGLAFGDPHAVRSRQQYRALIFVNGWSVGQFIAHVGPQRVFVLPAGIVNPRGSNTLALAVTSDGAAENVLEPLHLVVLHAARGGTPIKLITAPDYSGWSKGTR
jgi:beta-galactosidase GanA